MKTQSEETTSGEMFILSGDKLQTPIFRGIGLWESTQMTHSCIPRFKHLGRDWGYETQRTTQLVI